MPSTRPSLPPPRPATVPAAALLALAGVLAAGACGQSTGPAATPAGTPGAPTASPSGPASATALDRTGGVSGFADRLTVAADGHVTGTTRSGSVDCRVPATAATTLASAPAPTVPPAAGTDRMTVTVTRDEGPADLGEAQGSDPLSTTARQLLDDVQLPTAQRTVCR